ncbi:hypothetical protein CDV31_017017 [Fusarium ambrosium]|uniref:Uncharacterized protein n=1 Tax=Fusarium ambrosium TaxID=131363 RepID=A0A428RVW7_9HYPO|nr:hypothetical protein CDV31_017017 [Fusarium ambrosium]
MPPRIGRRKEQLGDFLQRVEGIDPDAEDSELFQLNQRSKELDNLAHGFRHHSLRTQLQQDSHLQLYRNWAKIILTDSHDGSGLTDDDLDRLCFPDPSDDDKPFAKLESQLRRFLVFAVERCVPRSIDDDHISYRVLVHYRRSMIFWVLRKYDERHIVPPKRVWLDSQMTEIMRCLKNLKTNSVDPEKGDSNKSLILSLHSPKGQLAFEFSAPHRILTIALRRGVLLGIDTIDDLFVRREKNILIKDEFKEKPILLSGGPRGRSVRADVPMSSGSLTEYLKLRGQKIGLTKEITFYSIRRSAAMDLSSKIGSEMTRAIMAHDPQSVVMEKYYTAQRTSLPDLTALALGDDEGQVDHRPIDGSLVFSRLNQDQMRRVGPMLNTVFQELREMDEEYPHNGDARAKKYRDRIIRRAALRSVMKELADEQSKNLTIDETTMRMEQLQSMSREFNNRVLDQARQHIANQAPATTVDDESENPVDDAGVDLGVDFLEDDEQNEPEGDAEDVFQRQIDQGEVVEAFPDELSPDNDITHQLSEIDYATAARAAMEIWLAVGTEASAFGSKMVSMVTCSKCQEDETVNDEAKSKLWHPSKLARHINSEFHSGFKKFFRRAQNKAKLEQLGGLQCEICAAIAPPDITIPCHSTVKTLLLHIERCTSTSMTAGEPGVDQWWAKLDTGAKTRIFDAHERVKREIGWYDDDFRGDRQHKATVKAEFKQRDNKRLSILSNAFKFSGEKQLSRPIPIGRELIRGRNRNLVNDWVKHHGRADIIEGSLMNANPTLKQEISEQLQFTKQGPMPTESTLATAITDRYKHMVTAVPMPGTPGNLSIDKQRVVDKLERESR